MLQRDAIVGGHSLKHDLQAAQRQIGVCAQFDVLFESLTTLEHVLFFTRLRGNAPRKLERDVAVDLVEKVGLQSMRSRYGKKLSGGQKRRLSLAIALCGNPQIVFLDEPSSALDVASTRAMWDVIKTVAGAHTLAVLLVLRYCCHITHRPSLSCRSRARRAHYDA